MTWLTRAASGHIFINYRGSDAGWAVYLDNVLTARFGGERVFRASRSIEPGEDFPARILSSVEKSTVLVAIIGPRWLAASDRDGARALDNGHDWVRREIAHALRRQVVVLPLLVDGAEPLDPGELPDDIAQLARSQYLRMSYRSAQTDTQRLESELAKYVRAGTARARRRWRLAAATVVTSVTLLAAGAAVWHSTDRPGTGPASPATTGGSSRTASPWVTVRPAGGGPQDPIRLRGAGFPPNRPVRLSILMDDRWVALQPRDTDEFGELLASVDPRAELAGGRLPPGEYQIATNVDDDPRYHVRTTYTVTAPG
jgi:TIR domain